MNKAKQFAMVSSALLLAGVATTSLASGCGTSISQTTANCLSTAATTEFLTNYQANLAAEGGNNVGNSYGSSMPYKQPANTQAAPKNQPTQNNNTNTHKKGINWF